MIHVSISVANNFVHSSTAADQGYHAFGELARFVYCLLQKFSKASSLPLVEQWEEYVVPNQSRFPAIDDRDFLAGTRLMAALDKVGSHYLQTEFRRDARPFLSKFVNCVLSTVASRSVIGRGLSCFCPAIVVGGDDVARLQLFNKLLDELLEKGWTRGSKVKLKRAKLSTSPLCRNSGSWSGRPHFTQRSSFSESGLTMLSESLAIADSITPCPVSAPWSVVESACASLVITDLGGCWERVVLRRRTAKDSSERWYHDCTPRSETASSPGVIISDVVEEGRVEYVPVAAPALGPPGPSKIRSSSSKRKREISRNPVKLPRRFEVLSPRASSLKQSLVEDPNFASTLATPASHGKSRRSGRDFPATPVFQTGFP